MKLNTVPIMCVCVFLIMRVPCSLIYIMQSAEPESAFLLVLLKATFSYRYYLHKSCRSGVFISFIPLHFYDRIIFLRFQTHVLIQSCTDACSEQQYSIRCENIYERMFKFKNDMHLICISWLFISYADMSTNQLLSLLIITRWKCIQIS